jgi:hypothetical protein
VVAVFLLRDGNLDVIISRMTSTRFKQLMDDCSLSLTAEEIAAGWHFCAEFDGLLVKGDAKEPHCGAHCVDGTVNERNEVVQLTFKESELPF